MAGIVPVVWNAFCLLHSFKCHEMLLAGKKKCPCRRKTAEKAEDQKVTLQALRYFFLLYGSSSGWCGHPPDQFGGKEYPGIVIYAVASYTFCKIIFAVINVFRARKKRALSLMIIRDIGYVDACVSILSLQTAMVAQFGGGEEAFARMMNGITGTAVCLMILGLGIYYMLLAGKGTKRKWRSKNDDTYPCCGR